MEENLHLRSWGSGQTIIRLHTLYVNQSPTVAEETHLIDLQVKVKSTSTVSPIISCPWSLLKQAKHLSSIVGPGQIRCPEPEKISNLK